MGDISIMTVSMSMLFIFFILIGTYLVYYFINIDIDSVFITYGGVLIIVGILGLIVMIQVMGIHSFDI